MYSVRPLGLNIKDNDRDVPDGSLQESINMQWRDGSFKPIPERIITEINASGYRNIILHKVGDENTINVLGFKAVVGSEHFLAYDLAGYLGGYVVDGYVLEWFGTITNGTYVSQTAIQLPFVMTPGMSYVILNGICYFMGNGLTEEEQYFVRIEFDEVNSEYKVYDMYAWKSLIPFYPYQSEVKLLAPKNTYQAFTKCGLVLVRFALVLKTGEVVLHSPIYGCLMYGLNRSATALKRGDIINNIHTFINLDLSFADMTLFNEEISAINVYATTPYYETKFLEDLTGNYTAATAFKDSDIKGKFKIKAEEPFYLIKTIDAPVSNDKILLTVGGFDNDIILPAITPFSETIYSKIDANTISAGEIMPVDNFSYHKLFGKITSYNGRLVIKRPVTLLSGGHIRALATLTSNSNVGFSIDTEDGRLYGISYQIDKSIQFTTEKTLIRGLLSYPDRRTSLVYANDGVGNNLRMFKCRGNNAHNMACSFDIYSASDNVFGIQEYATDTTKLQTSTNYSVYISYQNIVGATGGDYINYVVPLAQIDGRDAFEVPDVIDLEKDCYVSSAQMYIRNVDYTVDNAGTGGVGRFVFVVPPTKPFNLSYYTPITESSAGEIPTVAPSALDANTKYSSENRVQFSQIGEFKVWPAANSYRIGNGKVMNLGVGSVDPSESQVISPIIIGTTDGVYTVNLDPMGNNFIASITKTKNIPFISEEILDIDQSILFVSDQGLMVYSNGDFQNLTEAYFPQQGNGNYPSQDNVFSGYNLLTYDFFGGAGNPYEFDDIVNYMKGAIMAYDGRRRNVWCSNSSQNFSLVYNLDTKQWGMSTLVFSEKQELFSIIDTVYGEVYSRYLVKKAGENNLLILSGEDLTKEVFYHVLTRPIKFQNVDDYKVLPRMISRTLLLRNSISGFVSIGLWGTQEVNKYKKSIPLAVKKDDRSAIFPNNMRYDLPVDCRKGKYKTITLLQAGKALPESYIASFDFDIYKVDNTKMR